MRVFVAIELEDDVKADLASVQDELKKDIEKGNFTSTDNFHLTLRFIGEVDEGGVQSIKEAIDETAKTATPFDLHLSQLGSFPKKNKEILWAGVAGDLENLHSLHDKIEEELASKNFKKDTRLYTPHITLGRNLRLNEEVDQLKNKTDVPASTIKVNQLSLMESTRINDELVYRPIYVKSF